jgi:hypothetical protein
MEHLAKGLHAKLDGHIKSQHDHNQIMQAHAEHQSQMVEEMHHLAHTGKNHPRVLARLKAGNGHTPEKPAILDSASPASQSKRNKE